MGDGFRLFGAKNNQKQSKLVTEPIKNDAKPVKNVDGERDNAKPAVINAISGDATNDAKSFADLGLADFLIDTLRSVAIHQPTEIQRACIGPILDGTRASFDLRTESTSGLISKNSIRTQCDWERENG